METEILRHIPADIHNHSTLSPDGCDEPMRMAERACGLGIKHFALTDHIECEKLESWDYAGAIARSHDVFLEIQEPLPREDGGILRARSLDRRCSTCPPLKRYSRSMTTISC